MTPVVTVLPCHMLHARRSSHLKGLLHGKKWSRRNVTIGFILGRGRSAFASKSFNPGDFVCEYQLVHKDKEADWGEMTNTELGLGYIFFRYGVQSRSIHL